MPHPRKHPLPTRYKASLLRGKKHGWTGVGSAVVEMDLLILGTDGMAGSTTVQAREVCDPTPAIGSG